MICGSGHCSAWSQECQRRRFGGAEENTNLLIFEIVTLFVTEERNRYNYRMPPIFRRAARQVKFKFLIVDISAAIVSPGLRSKIRIRALQGEIAGYKHPIRSLVVTAFTAVNVMERSLRYASGRFAAVLAVSGAFASPKLRVCSQKKEMRYKLAASRVQFTEPSRS